MNRDYSKGKIYKIVANTDEEYKPYVGSTVQGLAERMGGHRSNYKRWKEKETTLCSSFELFDKFGITKCKIILLEEYPCENIMQLLMKEREWFDKIECCNKVIPYRSVEEKFEYQKEYYDEHKEERADYYEANKNKILEQQKIHYEANKEQIVKRTKIYRESNKEIIAEKMKIKIDCLCGSTICKGAKAKHERSLKHQNYLLSLI